MSAHETFATPYYAVIFTNTRTAGDHGYREMAEAMEALAARTPGYLGFHTARNEDGFGIAVSFWESESAIAGWKRQVDHVKAQALGRATWYDDYAVHVAKVERAYTKHTHVGDR